MPAGGAPPDKSIFAISCGEVRWLAQSGLAATDPVRHPVDHANGFAMDIHLKTVPVIHFVVFRMDAGGSLSHGKESVRHFELDHFAAFKTFIADERKVIRAWFAYESR